MDEEGRKAEGYGKEEVKERGRGGRWRGRDE